MCVITSVILYLDGRGRGSTGGKLGEAFLHVHVLFVEAEVLVLLLLQVLGLLRQLGSRLVQVKLQLLPQGSLLF